MSITSSISKKELTIKPKCIFDSTHSPDRVSICGRCKIAKYCNLDCQKKDWQRHKIVCKPSSAGPRFRIVLQGEMAVVKPKNASEGLIKTTKPTTCTIFTLHDSTNHVGVLAHIDDYTGVAQTILEVSKQLKEKLDIPLSVNFTASVMGGTTEAFSARQQKLTISKLSAMKISVKVIDLGKELTERPQIVLNAYSGDLRFIHKKDSDFNYSLEYLQKREYGDFNNYLDLAYFGKPGAEIPDFQIREATRMEADVPKFKVKLLANGEMDMAFFQAQERKAKEQKMPLKLLSKREAV
jgi:hypothetical protein